MVKDAAGHGRLGDEGDELKPAAAVPPPKHITVAELRAFLRRVRAVHPDLALFVVDTALRLSDKILPMFVEALTREGVAPFPARRVFRETWALGPHLYLVNAREELMDNVCRAIAEGFRALGPAILGPGPA